MAFERPWPTSDEVMECFSLTLWEMIYYGEPITFASVAQKCGFTRSYLYRHPELRRVIEYYRTLGMSKAELQKEVTQLRDRVLKLELKFNERRYIRPFFPQLDAECIQADLGESHTNNI